MMDGSLGTGKRRIVFVGGTKRLRERHLFFRVLATLQKFHDNQPGQTDLLTRQRRQSLDRRLVSAQNIDHHVGIKQDHF
jgi:hypothetical protein